MLKWIMSKMSRKWRQRLCCHRYERSRFQFQVLSYDPSYDISYTCQKCGKLKFEHHD